MQADLIETELEGTALLTNPMLNKGTAFTDEERTAFSLHGLLPPHIGTLEVQSARRLHAMRKLASDLDLPCEACRMRTGRCFTRC